MMMANKMTIGILAYGSLIDDPGSELKPLILEIRKEVPTPFNVQWGVALILDKLPINVLKPDCQERPNGRRSDAQDGD